MEGTKQHRHEIELQTATARWSPEGVAVATVNHKTNAQETTFNINSNNDSGSALGTQIAAKW